MREFVISLAGDVTHLPRGPVRRWDAWRRRISAWRTRPVPDPRRQAVLRSHHHRRGASPTGQRPIWGQSEGLRTLLIERGAPAASRSARGRDYLRIPSGISGAILAQRAATPGASLGAEVLGAAAEVVGVRREDPSREAESERGIRLCGPALHRNGGEDLRRARCRGTRWGRRLLWGSDHRGRGVSRARCLRTRGSQLGWTGRAVLARYARNVVMLVRARDREVNVAISHFPHHQQRRT